MKNYNRKKQQIDVSKITVNVFYFKPFATRAQIFPNAQVIGITFAYSPSLVKLLKGIIGFYRNQAIDRSKLALSAGGWLPLHKCWFIEESIWPMVKTLLIAAKIEIREVASK